jgi:FkbM family methyltransferase
MNFISKIAYSILKKYRKIMLARIGTEPIWVKLNKGFWMKIDPLNDTDQTFYFGNYERALSNFVSNFVKPGDLCFDIGTHKGYFTLQMAQKVGSTGRVYSFDPDPNAFEILEQNRNYNKFNQVVLNHIALADKKGTCEFFLNNYLGHSSRFPNEYAAPNVSTKISVPTTTLDAYVAENNITPEQHKISFVKIDAEGSEPLIISAMGATMEKFSPAIHMEINYLSLKAADVNANVIEDHLRKYGYSIYIMDFVRTTTGGINYTFVEVKNLDNTSNKDMIDIIAINKSSEYWARFQSLKK